MTKSVGTTFFYTAFCKSNLSIMSEIPKLNFPCVPNFVTRNLESVAHTPLFRVALNIFLKGIFD